MFGKFRFLYLEKLYLLYFILQLRETLNDIFMYPQILIRLHVLKRRTYLYCLRESIILVFSFVIMHEYIAYFRI